MPNELVLNRLRKKQYLCEDILHEIGRYQAQHGPVGLQMLARKFSKRANDFAGLRNLLRELEMDGSIECAMTHQGRVLISLIAPIARRAS